VLPTTEPRTLHIEPFDGAEDEWNSYVRALPGSTFCHQLGWRDIIAGALGHRCIPLAARDDDGRLVGVLPLARVRSRLFGDYLISMPFLNYGGAVGDPAACFELSAVAHELAQKWRVRMLELRTREDTHSPLGEAARKVTVLLPLPSSSDELWSRFPSKLRSQIRRPLKENMEVRFGADQRDAFYEVFRRNMHDLGTPVLPARLFEAIAGMFGDDVIFAAVYAGDRPVAGGCGFVWGNEFEITWASSLRAFNSSSPNMLLYWSLMQRMIERGVGVFNFGRCTPDGGTHRFKLQWGGETVRLPWRAWMSAGSSAAMPTADRSIFRFATEAWSRMPAAAADRLGPLLSRHLP
jgi:serine/alanine adding enzyme